jgi:hypothetical protein
MRPTSCFRTGFGLSLLLSTAACGSTGNEADMADPDTDMAAPGVDMAGSDDDMAPPVVDMAPPTRGTRDTLAGAGRSKAADILFVIDNSSAMSAKQKQLVSAIDGFITQLDATGSDYHLGVVTTDIGTLPPPGDPFPGSNDPRCATLKGDDGMLQNTSCRQRTQYVSTELTMACSALCPTNTVLPQQRFIAKSYGVLNVPNATAALRCMGLVGDGGCGVESPLEAVRRALDGHLAENSGFLRSSSVLAVIFLTDEDDCSVQMTQRTNLSPASMSCTTPTTDPDYSCYNLDYRCMAKDLVCNEPLNTLGAKTGCRERTTTFLEPVDKYSRFFQALRTSSNLVIGGLWSPSILDFNSGLTTPYGNGQLQVTLDGVTLASNFLNRGKRTLAACYNSDSTLTTDPGGYGGQAQLRLSSFLKKLDPASTTEQSICDVAAYPNIFNKVTEVIQKTVGPECLSVKPDVDSSGAPACQVGFVPVAQPSQPPASLLPICGSGCCNAWADSPMPLGLNAARDPSIVTACSAEPQDCYCAVSSSQGLCPATNVAGLWRVGNAALPAGMIARFRCTGDFPPSS